MGSIFELGINAPNEQEAESLLQAGVVEIRRIEQLLSSFLPDSETSRINQKAFAEAVVVSAECFGLLQRSLAITQLTDGCFDITVGPLKNLYNFKKEDFQMPAKSSIREALQGVGHQRLVLDPVQQSIRFTHPKTSIGFEAIGKGYASDRVKQLWIEAGVTSAYINASGDLNTIGSGAGGTPWKIGIADPQQPKNMMLYLPLVNSAVATSGDYEQHFRYRGKRYSHNINPKTGRPLSGISSVTVASPSAELSDALATAVSVKGTKEGIAFVNQLPKTHVIIIDDANNCHFSKHIEYEAIPTQ